MTDSTGNAGSPESPDKPENPGGTPQPPSQAPGYPPYPPPPPQYYSPQYSGTYPPPTGPYPGGYPPPPPMPYGGYGPTPEGTKNGLGLGALISGLLSVPAAFTVIGGILLGLVAIVLGLLGHGRARRGEASNGGLAIAGVVLGVLGIILSVVLAITAWGVFREFGGRDLVDCMQSAGSDRVAQQQCEDEFRGNLEDRFSIPLTPGP
jgi:Domain of unknown function (DUF4190)